MTQQSVNDLIRVMREGDFEAQEAAAQQLAALGEAAVTPLIDVLREYTSGDDLYTALNNSHHWAEMALIVIGTPAVDLLIEAVKEDNLGARVGAIFCLGELQEVRAVQPLIEALWRDDDGSMTYSDANDALQKIGTIAVRPLIHALENSNATVRNRAARILGDFKDPLATPSLINALSDESPDVRISAAAALGDLVDARSIEPLIETLADHDPAVRETVVRALGDIGRQLNTPSLTGVLATAMRDEDWGTRQSAAEMLIRLDALQSAEARALLLGDLQSEAAEVRLGAAWSLIPMKEPQALGVLAQLLLHENADISSSAALALGEFGERRAIPRLVELLSHQDTRVKHAAQSALRKLGHDIGD